MRIQHNITAMNAYRNYNTNNNALASNLEKLSSGYKINRAGDDAAGLAISEKMRAQITGLEGAQQNAQDGISLVQTAEGALTEVHDMLNRMYALAEQSANGTYEDENDRVQLQKEVAELKSEIDRIADASNFNGINLLDGSLGSSSAGSVAVDVQYDMGNNTGAFTLQAATATEANFTITGLSTSSEQTLSIQYKDANGALQSKEVTFTSAGTTGATDNDAVLKTAVEEAFGDGFTVDVSSGVVTITSNDKGASEFEIFTATATDAAGTEVKASAVATTEGTDAYYQLDSAALQGYDGTGEASDHIFTINGQKFAFATEAGAKKLDADVNYIEVAAATPTNTEVAEMVKLINNKTGIGAEVNGTTDTKIDLMAGTASGGTGTGLSLQIGDTGDSFNQLNVTIKDCHTTSIGVAGVDIGTQAGAKAALATIESAINYVSDVRGGLGATQNRLEHTINNLATMQENIQDAESSIRDTDVAEEMMEYTKNNILIQSAQAMLAQANQVPQGVLQLLQ